MTPQQYQYYSFLEESRKRAMFRTLLSQQTVSIIRRAIDSGIDPREDPDLRKYWLLLTEDEQQNFISEIERIYLVREEESFDD